MSSELILTLAIPLIASITVALLESNVAHAISLTALGLTLIINTHLLTISLAGTTQVCGSLIGDPIGLLMSELILIVGFISVSYSFQYFPVGQDRRSRFFMALMLAFASTLIGLALSSNILGMLLFLEASTVLSVVLIIYGERGRKAMLAASIYLVMSIVESLLIVGGIYYLAKASNLQLSAINIFNIQKLHPVAEPEASIAAFLILLGFGTKAGIIPLALIWLPITHAEAPSPVSANLSGVMIEAAFIATLRCAYALLPHASDVVITLLAGLGMASIWAGIFGMIIDRDLKRVLAFSSILSMGSVCMVTGLSLASSGENLAAGLQGVLYYLTAHSVGKALLFLGSGSYLKKIGERNWTKMAGATKILPITSALWIVGVISIAGLFPPAAGYYAKHLMINCIDNLEVAVCGIPAFYYKLSLYAGGIAIFLILLGFTVFSLRGAGEPNDVSKLMLISKIALAAICIILGLVSTSLEHELFATAVNAILRLGGG